MHAALRESHDVTHNILHLGRPRPPHSRQALIEAIHGLTTTLPAHYGQTGMTLATIDDVIGTTLQAALVTLGKQIRRSLPFESRAAA